MSSTTAIRAGRAFVELFADNSRLVRGLWEAETRVKEFGVKMQVLGMKLSTIGVTAAVPLGIATKVFADFDDQMRAVSAVTGATEVEFESLTEKAKQLGRTTSYTAAEVAGAMLELGRAGFDSAEIDAAIAGMLNLARATGIDLAEATIYAGNTLRSFNLPATETTRVCDVMVATANNSAQTLTDLGESMSYCAPIAAEYGLTLEQTSKALGSLANYGIKGSQAGTTLRRILTNLADPTIQKRLSELKIDVVDDKTGELRDVSTILRELGRVTESMSKDKKLGLFKGLFGLYAIAGGAKLTSAAFDKLYDAIDHANGMAATTAKRMDGGIGGSFRMLLSAVEGVAIAVGDALAPTLQKVTEYFTKASEGLAAYITKNKELIITIAKVVASVVGIGVALLTGSVAVLAFGKTIGLVAGSVSSLAKAATAGFGVVSGVIKAVTFTAGTALSVCVAAFAGMASALTATFTAVSAVATALFSASGTAIASILSPVGLTIAAIAALSGACYLVYKNATSIGQAFSNAFSSITDVINNAASSVGRFLTRFAEFKIITGLAKLVASGLIRIGSAFQWMGRRANQAVATLGGMLLTFVKKVASVGAIVGAGLVNGFSSAVVVVRSIVRQVVSIILGITAAAIKGIGSVFSETTGVVYQAISPVISIIGGIFGKATGAMKPFLSLLKSGAGAVGDFAKSFLTIRTIGAVFSGIATAVSSVVRVFTNIGGAIVEALFSVVRAIPNIVASMIRAFISFPGTLLKIFQSIPTMISGAFSFLYDMTRSVVSEIGRVLSGVAGFVTNAWSGVLNAFTTLFNSLGAIVANFGNSFVTAFASLGGAVDWLKTQFGNFVSFASETFDAVAKAIGRGDVEAALQVVWASLKLIWIKGSTSLLNAWFWVVDSLQTAWTTCVYSMSELLISSWFGVQEFWTESVYTMSTIWTEFSSGVVTAWKSAEESIAKGIGWIMAKMQGLDPNEMNKILGEQYDQESQQRETQQSQTLADIQKTRDSKTTALETEKQGVFDTLTADRQRSSEARNQSYQSKIAEQETELQTAQNEYNNAITQAKTPPEAKTGDEGSGSVLDSVTAQVQNVIKGFQANIASSEKISVSGSFSAAALRNMGTSSTMDRVAKATEKSEKHLDKIANKEKDENGGNKGKKSEDASDKEDRTTNELITQTRLLRDIASGAMRFV